MSVFGYNIFVITCLCWVITFNYINCGVTSPLPPCCSCCCCCCCCCCCFVLVCCCSLSCPCLLLLVVLSSLVLCCARWQKRIPGGMAPNRGSFAKNLLVSLWQCLSTSLLWHFRYNACLSGACLSESLLQHFCYKRADLCYNIFVITFFA